MVCGAGVVEPNHVLVVARFVARKNDVGVAKILDGVGDQPALHGIVSRLQYAVVDGGTVRSGLECSGSAHHVVGAIGSNQTAQPASVVRLQTFGGVISGCVALAAVGRHAVPRVSTHQLAFKSIIPGGLCRRGPNKNRIVFR